MSNNDVDGSEYVTQKVNSRCFKLHCPSEVVMSLSIKRKIEYFTSQSCSDGKEMYNETSCTSIGVVLLILTYCFFAVLVAVAATVVVA